MQLRRMRGGCWRGRGGGVERASGAKRVGFWAFLSLGALTWSHVTHFVLMTHYKSDRTDSYGYISNVDCFFVFLPMAKHEKGVVSTNDNDVYVTHVENYLVSFSSRFLSECIGSDVL